MELSEAFGRRRSCRSYTSDPVDDAVLHTVLDAARRAPSAGNSFGIELLVLTGDQTEAYWSTTMTAARRAAFAWPGLLRAPVLIIPTVSAAAYVQRYSEADKTHSGLGDSARAWSVPYWWVDGGAAVMAMLLAATDAGLGSLFFGQFRHGDAIALRFGIPTDRAAIGTIALGWPDGEDRSSKSSARRRGSVDDIVHFGRW